MELRRARPNVRRERLKTIGYRPFKVRPNESKSVSRGDAEEAENEEELRSIGNGRAVVYSKGVHELSG